jgi:DnaA family protein
MEQLAFDLGEFAAPSFANFAAGANAEALAALRRAASGGAPGEVVYLWGVEGAGKSHLLHAAVGAARTANLHAELCDLAAGGDPPEGLDERGAPPGGDARAAPGSAVLSATVASASGARPPVLLALDHVDVAAPEAQAAAFTLFNLVRGRGGCIVAAGRTPPRLLPVRDDLRTRLGWGLSLEVLALTDAEKCAAMIAAGAERGVVLGADIADFLLRHGPRDMRSLLGAVAALDRYSLARHRPLTLPLARAWLREAARPLASPNAAPR